MLPCECFNFQVRRNMKLGNEKGASMASEKALKYSQRAILVGVLAWCALLLLLFCVLLFGALYTMDYFRYYRN